MPYGSNHPEQIPYWVTLVLVTYIYNRLLDYNYKKNLKLLRYITAVYLVLVLIITIIFFRFLLNA